VDGRGSNAKRDSSFPDGQQFAVRFFVSGLEAWDIPMAAQVADVTGLESVTISRPAPLPIEDASDDPIGVMAGQPANKSDRVLVGADSRRPRTRQRSGYFIQCTTLPTDRKMRNGIAAVDFDGDFFDERSQ
jgi:hypothetical protein